MALKSETKVAALFLGPTLAMVVVFRLFPLLWGSVLSLTSTDASGHAFFVGLDNYRELARDPTLLASLGNTLILIATLPVWVMLPLLLAILIHQGVPGGRLFRAVYFFPAVLSAVIIGSIFNVILRYDGNLNAALKMIGLLPVDWLGSGSTALFSLIAVQLWSTFGLGVLIFMAGMSTVSPDLIEAARLDGARTLQIWIHVILPQLRPILEFVVVVTTIGVLTSMFGLIYVLTAGGPGSASTLPEFLIWLEQGKMNRPGYASAMAMLLFVLMAGLAVAQIRIMSRNANL